MIHSKYNFSKSILMFSVILWMSFVSSLAFAQQKGSATPKQKSNEFQGSVSPFLHAAPKSLAEQKLIQSSYPDEAELYCGTDQCILGLTRGLVVGGDVAGMLYAPLRRFADPHWVSGTLTIADIYGGFQILRDVNAKNYMNAQIGYRSIRFDDSTNAIATQGFTTEIHYSQLVTPVYLQSLEFAGYFTLGHASLNNVSALNIYSSGHAKLNDTASYFYRISESYPTYQFSLPADVELINWSTSQTGLAMPIHGYLEVNPFYIQNNLNFSGNDISLQITEQNFGIRFAGIASYESSAEKAKFGRYALKSAVGIDFSTSNFSTTSYGNANLALPKRSFAALYLELAGSFQF